MTWFKSGSYTVRAKLLVPAGAPLQFKAGDTFWPLQPNPENTWAGLSFAPSVTSGLVSANAPARTATASSSSDETANGNTNRRMMMSSG